MTILYFIIALGVLVFIHEFGHFIVAKKQKIGVEKFSLGFGPKIFGFKRGETEYMLSALPLGGYVKLRGEDPDEADHNDPASFSARPIWHRIKVVVAGPCMNLLLALVLLPVVFMIGRMEPAYFQQPPVVLGVTVKSVAETAGLQRGDKLVAINQVAYTTWKPLLDFLLLHGGETIHLQLQRDGVDLEREMTIPAASGSAPGTLGIEPNFFVGNEAEVDGVMPDSPAAAAGFQVGDRIVEINGQKVSGWMEMTEMVNHSEGKILDLVLERAKAPLHIQVTPRKDATSGRWLLGIKKDYDKKGALMVERKYPFGQAIIEGSKENLKLAKMTLEVLGRLVTGKLSYKTLGGPIRIAQASGMAAAAGFSHFLYFMAFLSIQLGLLNLLPLPVLDGGHLFFYTIEAIQGRPLSMKARGIMEQVGFFLLLGLMLLITVNDVDSVWGFHSLFEKIKHIF